MKYWALRLNKAKMGCIVREDGSKLSVVYSSSVTAEIPYRISKESFDQWRALFVDRIYQMSEEDYFIHCL